MVIDPQTEKFILEHETDDIRQLALQAKRYSGTDFQFVIEQIAARQIAHKKVPAWYENKSIIYPGHLSMEQCSSQATALFKAALCSGHLLIDITGGLGIDFSFMSQHVEHAIYVEQNEKLIDIARHNFKALDLSNTEIKHTDGVEFLHELKDVADIIYIDPARRNTTGRKTVLIEDCSPNLIEIDETLNQKSHKCIIKLSPMLDITQALSKITKISDVYVISVNNECKELLLIKENKSHPIRVHCIDIKADNRIVKFGYDMVQEEAATATYTDSVSQYLYEPNSSILKAGGYKIVAQSLHLQKLHPNSHLYTSDILLEDFPGRSFIVKDILSLNKKDLKKYTSNSKQANISVRNFPLTVNEIRKQSKLADGGTDYIFATTLFNEKKVLILCKRVDPQQ